MLSEISPIAVKLFPAISKSFFCILVFSVCLSYFKHTCLSIFDKLREWKIQNYPVLFHSNIYEYTVMRSYFNIFFCQSRIIEVGAHLTVGIYQTMPCSMGFKS